MPTKTPATNTVQPPAPPAQASKSRRGLWFLVVFWVVFAALAVGVINKRQAIHDYSRLWNYQPPAAIQRLADQDTMTPYARHMFYLNKPQLASSVNSFRANCPDSRDTVVLGCYHPGEHGIYIYDVKDPELRGIAQVTAAHEDLHAIYGRLSDKERNYVNGLLQDYYDHGLTDDQVKSEIDLYKKTEPNDVLDEMHSTFGTEVANLPPALEQYYAKYFANRAAIVAYQQQYNQAFSGRQQVVAADDAQLSAMKQKIDAAQAAADSQQSQLSAARARMNSLLASGQNEAYNAEVASYNALVNAYNANVNALRTDIAAYNKLVNQRNAVADQINGLDKAIDTRQPQAVTAR